MNDMYGMLIILGLLLVISQCVNNERSLLESLTNQNVPSNVNAQSNKNAPSNVNTKFKSRPKQVTQQNNGNVFKYYPGEILNADANAPYGFNIPTSTLQEFLYLKDMGISKDSAMSQKVVTSGYAKFLPAESQFSGFDPTYKGGLLENQIGKHVKDAVDVSNKLQRNSKKESNGNVVPSNSNTLLSNSNVNSNRTVKSNSNSLIQSNSIGLSNGANGANGANGNGTKGINLYMIYTAWCGHSKKALPDFDKLMGDYDGKMLNGYKLNIKKYDADINEKMKKKYSIRGFPSYVMEVTKNGNVVGDFKPINERSYDGLLNYLKNNAV